MCRASSRTPSLFTTPAAAGSRAPVEPRYGRAPALPEPHARPCSGDTSQDPGEKNSFGIKEPRSAAASGCLSSSAGPCCARCRCAGSAGPAGDRGYGRLLVPEAHDRVGGKPCPAQTCKTSRLSWADRAVLAALAWLLRGSQLRRLGLIVAPRTIGRQGLRHLQTALRLGGGGTPRPAALPQDGAHRDHKGRQHRLDLAGPDQVAGIGEVEPVVGMDPDHAGLDLLLDMLQPQERLGRGGLSGAGAADGWR